MRYAIIYSSRTGNTALLAKEIRSFMNREECVYFGEASKNIEDIDLVFVGFWTDKGDCDQELKCYLESLYGKKIFLFGTAGFGGSEAYFAQILNQVETHISKQNTIIGTFLCQGKMPASVKERYIQMQKNDPDNKKIKEMIKNFDQALTHPDQTDLERLRDALEDVLKS